MVGLGQALLLQVRKNKMRKVIINILYFSGVFHLKFILNRLLGYFPVLVFHRVTPNADELTEPLNLDEFEKIIVFLSQKYDFCSIDNVNSCKSPCIMTFDDATTDFYDYAIPIIVKYDIPTTLFIPTSPADTGDEIWTNKLFSLFHSNKDKVIEINVLGNQYAFALSNQRGAQKLRTLINALAEMNPEDRMTKLAKIMSLFKEGDYYPLAETLSWDSLRKLHEDSHVNRLIEYGSHSHTHECLSTLKGSDLHRELHQSKCLIEQELNVSPDSIAYPSGLYNQEVQLEVRKHYKFGFTTSGKLGETGRLTEADYCYAIPRVSVYTNNPKELFIRMNGLETIITKFHRLIFFIKMIF